ncbi:branched-chain amino acid ABC transporter permease [Azospirillum lipoferum]|uniref:Branched-chain amino acids ABC transporter permease component n=1 Tax=Azospirillum lipoferum (strain 4B) TaxID=862719 RepID=G7ZGF5_AZOL4|nr:branched-chain amino acid ABC transporter permease [Azospirillum lipoferum]CBS90959.1 Branched-chain amino acids ABC transporter; permease component [Azospirillum lipoferum 4B]
MDVNVPDARPMPDTAALPAAAWRGRQHGWTLLLLVVAFGAVPAAIAATGSSYLAQIAITATIFVILSASLNHVTGTAGLLSIGHAAFYGIGAYAAALLSTKLGLPFIVTLPAAGLIAALFGLLVALPTMRLVSIYFAVATLGIGEMIYVILLNWVDLTRGPMGIRGIPPVELFGWQADTLLSRYLVVAAVAVASLWVLHRLTHSYYGNALRALREDDQCADSMGVDVVRLKIESFVVATFFAGIAGALLAHTSAYIAPDNFRFMESILILAMVVVGGLGSLPGAVVGALFMIVLPEALRGIGDYRMIAVGVTMFLSILLLPKGMLTEGVALGFVRRAFARGWATVAGGKPVGWK